MGGFAQCYIGIWFYRDIILTIGILLSFVPASHQEAGNPGLAELHCNHGNAQKRRHILAQSLLRLMVSCIREINSVS